jgi:hypothetical protein
MKGLIVDHPFDRLALTMRGRAVLKTMLLELWRLVSFASRRGKSGCQQASCVPFT